MKVDQNESDQPFYNQYKEDYKNNNNNLNLLKENKKSIYERSLILQNKKLEKIKLIKEKEDNTFNSPNKIDKKEKKERIENFINKMDEDLINNKKKLD